MYVSDQLHVPAALHPRKKTLVSIGYEAELASELVSRLRREEEFLPMTVIEPRPFRL
jgi:hypothetical protein